MSLPRIGADEERAFAKLVDGILDARVADPQADTSDFASELDWFVYRLHRLTHNEVAEVGGCQLTDEDLEDYELLLALEESMAEEGRCDIGEAKAKMREIIEGRDYPSVQPGLKAHMQAGNSP